MIGKRMVLVAGNIGSGKTSLTERLGERLGWHTAFESVVDNPYLPDFYADMRSWAFHLQVFFLGHRARQHMEVMADPRPAIIDRSIYEDAYIFARALYEMGNLTERDFYAYRQVFDLVVMTLPAPSLLIYLSAPVETLVERIHRRGREMERSVSVEYLALLDRFYEEWIRSFNICPVLTIRSDDLDFVNQSAHLDVVVERIQNKLAGRDELVF
jgi:deoxyadenosine/deoxycytidine kinase